MTAIHEYSNRCGKSIGDTHIHTFTAVREILLFNVFWQYFSKIFSNSLVNSFHRHTIDVQGIDHIARSIFV